MTAWRDLSLAVTGGPKLPIRGVVTRHGSNDQDEYATRVAGDIKPVYVVGHDDLTVWRDGARLRVETTDGRPLVISDGTTVWRFNTGGGPPQQGSSSDLAFIGPGRELLLTQTPSQWSDKTRHGGKSIREVTFLARPCWEVEVTSTKDGRIANTLIVDQGSGAVLRQQAGLGGVYVEYSSFAAGPDIDATVFEWNGPSSASAVMPDALEYRRRRPFVSESEAKMALASALVDHNITGDLRISPDLDFSVARFTSQDADGRFEAIIGLGDTTGWLTRRPRQTSPWQLHFPAEVQSWSTKAHDWAIALYSGPLDATILTTLQDRLHPSLPVDGKPMIRPID